MNLKKTSIRIKGKKHLTNLLKKKKHKSVKTELFNNKKYLDMELKKDIEPEIKNQRDKKKKKSRSKKVKRPRLRTMKEVQLVFSTDSY
jgi:hypothetical protein